jgi:predicted nucleic acid-binding protein
MHAVDTNALVRLITRDDARRAAAAESFVASGGWVGHLVLAETTWRYRRHPRVDFSDCLVLEIARKAGHLPVGTFDRRFAKLDGAQKI